MFKSCNNCKHIAVYVYARPCTDCVDASNWESGKKSTPELAEVLRVVDTAQSELLSCCNSEDSYKKIDKIMNESKKKLTELWEG